MNIKLLATTLAFVLSGWAAAPIVPTATPLSAAPAEADSQTPATWVNPELEAEIDAIAQRNSVQGCSVAVFDRDQIVFTHSYGVAARRNGQTISAGEDTKYRVASISKMVSCLLAMTLRDQGKLRLDDQLSTLVNENLYSPAFSSRPTVAQLLMHTSGITDGWAYTEAISSGSFPSLDTILARQNPFVNPPGEVHNYSNFGMGLIGGVVEQASGQHFYDYADQTLFDAMGLDAGYMTDSVEDKASIAQMGYTDPLNWGEMKRLYANIPQGQMYLLAHGELYISAIDLARVSMILAGDGTYGGQRYLSQEAVHLINQPYVQIGQQTFRGLSVQISRDLVEGVELIGHQGNAYGAITCVFYDPQTSRGVVFLSNGANGLKLDNQVYQVNQDIVQAVWRNF